MKDSIKWMMFVFFNSNLIFYKYSEFLKEINKNNYKIDEEILKKIYKLIN